MTEPYLLKLRNGASELGRATLKTSRNFAIAGLVILSFAVIADCFYTALSWEDRID